MRGREREETRRDDTNSFFFFFFLLGDAAFHQQVSLQRSLTTTILTDSGFLALFALFSEQERDRGRISSNVDDRFVASLFLVSHSESRSWS